MRALGLLDATAIVMGSMIGSGVFIVSSDVARLLGSPVLVLIAWALGGAITVFAAVSYGELAAAMPRAGGQYVYLREAYGPLTGFLYGWTLFLVIQSGTIAAVAVAFARYLDVFVPLGAVLYERDLNLLGYSWHFSFGLKQLVAVIAVMGLSGVNCLGIKTGALVQNAFTAAKVLALAALALAAVVVGTGTLSNFLPVWPDGGASAISAGYLSSPQGSTALLWPEGAFMGAAVVFGVAMIGPLFSSDAWVNVTFTGAEVKNPERNLPLSLFLGTLLTTLIYLAVNAAYFYVLTLPEAVSTDKIAASAALRILGEQGNYAISGAILISTFGCLNGLILSGPRVYYAMAWDRLFFPQVAALNSRGAPAASLILQGAWASLLAVSGTYSQLLTYVVSAALVFYILTVLSLFIFRKRGVTAGARHEPGHPQILRNGMPLAYVLCAAAILAANLIGDPRSTWPGFLIIGAGLPAYAYWRFRAGG